MKLHQSLIASIRQNAKMFRKLTGILFEQLKVVFIPITKDICRVLNTFSISNYLCFLSVAVPFSTVAPFWLFWALHGLFADIHQRYLEHHVAGLECLLTRQA